MAPARIVAAPGWQTYFFHFVYFIFCSFYLSQESNTAWAAMHCYLMVAQLSTDYVDNRSQELLRFTSSVDRHNMYSWARSHYISGSVTPSGSQGEFGWPPAYSGIVSFLPQQVEDEIREIQRFMTETYIYEFKCIEIYGQALRALINRLRWIFEK